MKKWIITVAIVLLLVVLYLALGVNEQILGDDYYYLPEYEAIDVGYPNGAIICKSTNRYEIDEVKIHKNVVSVNKNRQFIIAIQQDDSVNIKGIQQNVPDSNHLHYYIIVKQSDRVYGPYSKIDYLKKRDELKIPHRLKFEDEQQN